MELCDRGSLLKMRERFWGLLKEDRSKALLCIYKTLLEIVFGMEYLHSIEVVHGDLKCGNVLCFSKVNDPRGFSCKVCDFGLSRSKEGLAELYSSSFGTAVFASPELLSTGSVGFASDVYAFAMLAWHLLSMGSVATAMEDYQVIHQVCHNKWRPPIPDTAPDGLRCLMTACWSQDQELRPTFTEIRKSLIDQFHNLP
jgi:serine/threonine protein kinase